MTSTNLNIRTDKEIKDAAEKIFSEFGLTMTAAVNMFLRQVIRENGIPFSLKLDRPNKETLKAIDDALNHRDVIGTYDTVDDFMEALKAKD